MDTLFLDALASESPTPGGGGASAACGALAAALASMVGNLTVGKPKYAQVEGEMKASLARLEDLRAHLVSLVDEDAAAFEPLARAYKMPKDTPQCAAARQEALQQALAGACEAPLAIMRRCAAVLDECEFMALHGSRLAVSDAGAAAVLAKAAAQAASLNVVINAASLEDSQLAQAYAGEADALLARCIAKADGVYARVLRQLQAN